MKINDEVVKEIMTSIEMFVENNAELLEEEQE